MLLQIFFYLVKIRPFLQYKDTINPSEPLENKLFFLIIVKNEYHQLHELLTAITNQSFGKLEIAIVDDHSDPQNRLDMENIVGQFKGVNIFDSTGNSGKKHAIYAVIENLDKQSVVFIDADCRPSSKNYTKILAKKLSNKELVIGYGPLFKEEGFLNKLSRFDTMWIAAQYFGSAVQGKAYMAVGRNMAIRTKIYQSVLSKIKAKEILSGDDDMLIQALGTDVKMDIMIDPDSFMYSKSEENYISLLRQKTRHVGTSLHYKLRDKIWLSFTAFLSIICYPAILFYFCFYNVPLALILLVVKIILTYLIFIPIAKKLKENDLILLLPLWEMIYGIHLVILVFYGMNSNKKVWK